MITAREGTCDVQPRRAVREGRVAQNRAPVAPPRGAREAPVGGGSDVVVDTAQRSRWARIDLPCAARVAVARTSHAPQRGLDALDAAAASGTIRLFRRLSCRPRPAASVCGFAFSCSYLLSPIDPRFRASARLRRRRDHRGRRAAVGHPTSRTNSLASKHCHSQQRARTTTLDT
jgi:hypothetical protein